MKWNNLKLNLCPKCDEDLTFPEDSTTGETLLIKCPDPDCGFKISDEKMDSIVNNVVKEQMERNDEPDRSGWDYDE